MNYNYSINKQYSANNYNNTSLDQSGKYSYNDSFHTSKVHKVSQQEQIVSLLLQLISLLQNSSSSSKGTSSSISELTLNPGEKYRLSQALNFNEASDYKIDNVLDLDQSYNLSSGDKVLGRNLGRPFEHIIGPEHLNYLEQTNSVILDLNLDELNAVDDAIYPYPNEGGMEAVFDNDLSGTVSIGDSALRASGFAGSSHEIPITSEHLARLGNLAQDNINNISPQGIGEITSIPRLGEFANEGMSFDEFSKRLGFTSENYLGTYPVYNTEVVRDKPPMSQEELNRMIGPGIGMDSGLPGLFGSNF